MKVKHGFDKDDPAGFRMRFSTKEMARLERIALKYGMTWQKVVQLAVSCYFPDECPFRPSGGYKEEPLDHADHS